MTVVSPGRNSDETMKSDNLTSFSSPSVKSKSDCVSDNSGVSIAGYQSDEKSDSSVHQRKDQDIQVVESSKSEEYRMLFHLPPEEVLLGDYNCALQDNILLQGHMYLFTHHICFYANIFGYETKRILPFYEVSSVRKAKTAGIFPNAIEIVVCGKKHFFASFLSRDEAYNLILDGWCQHSDSAKSFIDSQEPKSEHSSQENLPIFFEKIKNLKHPVNDLYSMYRNKEIPIVEKCNPQSSVEDDTEVLMDPSKGQHNENKEEESIVNGVFSPLHAVTTWELEDVDAPKVPDYYTMVAESCFPIRVEMFFKHYFSNQAVGFVEEFHRKCGDKDFQCTSWNDNKQLGHAREISFYHPIKIYFGAKYGHCKQVQKFRVYKNNHLIIETSQRVNDVPYGDYFCVEGLWDVEENVDNENSCILRVYVNVAFSRKTMWKGKIEQSTTEECREVYSMWINNARALLAERNHKELIGNTDNARQINDGLVKSTDRTKDAWIPRTLSITLPNRAASICSSFEVSWTRFCVWVKNRANFPVILVILLVSILVIMQASTIILLVKREGNSIHRDDYIGGTMFINKAKDVFWLQQRVNHLKNEMSAVESHLTNMQYEYRLLLTQLRDLEKAS